MIPIYLMQDNQPFRLDVLTIAGGAGGGSGDGGGGGGAGGYLCTVPGESSGGPSTALDRIVFTGGENITVTIGAGGSGVANGNNSVFGSLTAVGGGRGASRSGTDVGAGGSGGGGSAGFNTGGLGTSNQGNDGSDYVTSGANYPITFICGGGGGAGQDPSSSGNGGSGIASSITGSSVTRGGGGGAASGPNYSGSVGTGGSGGGGVGAVPQTTSAYTRAATSGTANTGSGGGGGYIATGYNLPPGSGGSGIVVLRYPSLARIIDYIDPGLTYSYSDDGTWKRYIFTSGSGSIRF